MQSAYESAAELIAEADAMLIGAGAGMGVDSGLPDFRGNAGFWRAYPAMANAGISFTEVASPRTFATKPRLAWGFYGHRLSLYRETVPHAGFQILRDWGQRMRFGCRVFTSNVDGQFQSAGFSGDAVHECHGSIHHLQCTSECGSGIWTADEFMPDVDVTTCEHRGDLPLCPHCAHLARPNVLMFGDWSWRRERTNAQQVAEQVWLDQLERGRARMVIVELGAGVAIPSVRHFSTFVGHKCRAPLIRINPREAEINGPHDVSIQSGALAGLTGIQNALNAI